MSPSDERSSDDTAAEQAPSFESKPPFENKSSDEGRPAFEHKSFESKGHEGKGGFEKKPNFLPKRPHIDRPERFEDFIAWTEARRLTNRVYEITEKPEFAADLAFKAEIRRFAAQVMSYLAEAVEGGGEREFHRGLQQAKGAAAAARSLLHLAIDRGYLTEQESTELQGRTSSVGRIIGGQLAKLKRAETTDAKKSFGGKPAGGGYGAKKPYGGGGYGAKKPYGSGGSGGPPSGGPRKPFRPKREE